MLLNEVKQSILIFLTSLPFNFRVAGHKYLPTFATSSTVFPCSCAMKPSTLNMTNPAKKLVPELAQANSTESL